MDINLNGGVLIIGSLFWDPSQIRENWRTKNLKPTESAINVPAPIRYGRVSKTRNCTYSMVFSYECLESSKLGKAKFIEFVNNPINLEGLWLQCKELIKAECDKSDLSFDVFNWKWGALGLCINPETKIRKENEVTILIENWQRKYGTKKPMEPSDFEVNNEGLIFNNSGLLSIKWPTELNDYDFYIATASKPELKEYPNPFRIAERMVVNEDESYFFKNLSEGISTFQDEEIKSKLDELKATR